MKVEQFHIDIKREHADKIIKKNVLPEVLGSTNDTLRIRVEIRQDFANMEAYVAQLLPVEGFGKKGYYLYAENDHPIEDVVFDLLDDEDGITITLQIGSITAHIRPLGTEATHEEITNYAGEFKRIDNSLHFMPREVILARSENCQAAFAFDGISYEVVHAEKTSFERFPTCGCCGPKEEVFSITED